MKRHHDKIFGARLKDARSKARMTLEAVAASAKGTPLPCTSIARWERGFGYPPLSELSELARIYGESLPEWAGVAAALQKIGIGQNAPNMANADQPTAI